LDGLKTFRTTALPDQRIASHLDAFKSLKATLGARKGLRFAGLDFITSPFLLKPSHYTPPTLLFG
jgi:hypothetical protein